MQGIENLDHDQLVHVISAVFQLSDKDVHDMVVWNQWLRAIETGGDVRKVCGQCKGIIKVLTAPSICPCCGQEENE